MSSAATKTTQLQTKTLTPRQEHKKERVLVAISMIYLCVCIALLAALVFASKVLRIPMTGNPKEVEKFQRIAGAIQEGALAFLRAEYKYVA